MASFTDIVPQFNPYVQQLPVQAMVEVGMEKQRRYEEGVQRIQSQIEKVAGLSVLRPVDKQYLQSKLNELGNNLKGVAAGDFSNFQLVNSVGGMIGQIAKDPIINAAVRSAQVDKENIELMEKERASGKLTPQNEYFYNLQRGKYLNTKLTDDSGKPISFSGRYITHKDINAKLKELAKEVGVDENLVQNMYNSDGTLNKVMVETLTKGKDADKLYNAFINGLGPEDYQQLAIDGIYKYRGNDATSMINIFKSSNDDFVATANNKLADIKTQINELNQKKGLAKSPEEIEALKKQISSLEGLSSKISNNILDSNNTFEEMKRGLSHADDDHLNSVKGQLYSNNFLKTLSKSFAESTSHVKIVENPLFKAMMEENKFALDTWYKKEQVKIDWAKLAAAKEANRLKAEENRMKQQELLPVTTPSPGALPGEKISKVDLIVGEHTGNIATRKELLKKLALPDMRRVFGDRMEEWIRQQAKSRNQTPDEVIETYGTQVLARIKTGATKPTSENVTLVQNLNKLNNVISGMTSQLEAADKEAYALSGLGDIEGVKTSDGRELFSAKDLLDVSNLISKSKTVSNVGVIGAPMYAAGAGEVSFDTNKILKSIGDNPQKLAIANAIIKKMQGKSLFGINSSLTDAEKIIVDKANEVVKLTEKKQDVYNRTKEEIYGQKFSGFFPHNESITLTEKSRPAFKANLTAAIGDRPEFSKTLELANEDGSQVFFSTTPSLGGVSFNSSSKVKMIVFGKKGEKQEVEITPVQYAFLLGKNVDEVDPEVSLGASRVNFSPDKSSNKNGIGNIYTEFFPSESFVNIKDYKINGGDYIEDGSNPGVYYPKIYYTPKNANSPIVLDVGKPMSMREVLDFPKRLTEAELKQIINLQQ